MFHKVKSIWMASYAHRPPRLKHARQQETIAFVDVCSYACLPMHLWTRSVVAASQHEGAGKRLLHQVIGICVVVHEHSTKAPKILQVWSDVEVLDGILTRPSAWQSSSALLWGPFEERDVGQR